MNSLFLSALVISSLTTTPVNRQFEVSEPVSINIETEQLSYFRGVLSSDKPLKSAVIRNPGGQVIKSLLAEGEQESEIYWLAQDQTTIC